MRKLAVPWLVLALLVGFVAVSAVDQRAAEAQQAPGTGPVVTGATDPNTAPAFCSGATLKHVLTAPPGQQAASESTYVIVALPDAPYPGIQIAVDLTLDGPDAGWRLEVQDMTGAHVVDLDNRSPGSVSGYHVQQNVTYIGSAGIYRMRSGIDPYGNYPGAVRTSQYTVTAPGGSQCGSGAGCPCDYVSRRNHDNEGGAGRPIRTTNGAFYEGYTDLSVPGRSQFGLNVARMYYSGGAGQNTGAFGSGWYSSLDTRLTGVALPATTVTLFQDAGAQTVFYRRANATYAPLPGGTASLVQEGTPNPTGWLLGAPGGRVMHFLADGKIDWIQDRNGYKTSYGYTGGLLTSVAEDAASGGRQLAVTWQSGRISTITDPAGRKVTYTYGGTRGGPTDLTQVEFKDFGAGATDMRTYRWRYTYDGSHQLTRVRDPRQSAIEDASGTYHDLVNTYVGGKVTSQTDETNRVIGFDYTTKAATGGVIVTFGDANPGNGTTLAAGVTQRVDYYDTLGKRVKVTYGPYDTPVRTFTFSYDPVTGGLAGTFARVGAATVQVAGQTFTPTGDVSSTTQYFGTVPANYNQATPCQNPGTTPPGGSISEFCRVTTLGGYNAFNQPGTVTDNAGVTTTYTYDANGNVTQVCTPVTSTVPGPAGAPIDCTSGGITQKKVNALYDSPAHPGDVKTVTDENLRTTTFGYGSTNGGQYGYRTSTTGPALTNPTRPALVNTVVYDAVGRVKSATPPRGAALASTFETNFYGDVTKTTETTDPSPPVTQRVLNEDRQVTSLSMMPVQDGQARQQSYVYDDSGRLIQTDPGTGALQKTDFWPNGLLHTQKAFNPTSGLFDANTIYGYDSTGMLTTVQDPNLKTTTYGYDAYGHLATRQDPVGACPATKCVSYGTNVAGELTGVTYTDGTTPISNVQYDFVGRRSALAQGSAEAWTWDSAGRLTATADSSGTVGYKWDLANNLTGIAYPGGSCTSVPTVKCVTRHYDEANRFDATTDFASPAHTTTFVPDPDGNRTNFTYGGSSVNTDVATVDNADRLTGVTFNKNGVSIGSLGYTRLKAGELQSATPTTLPGAVTENYGYDAGDRLCWASSTASTNACGQVPGGARSYNYDNANNLTKQSDDTGLFHDPAGQLCYSVPATVGSTACTTPPANATTYGKDDRGNRTAKNPPGVLGTTYAYDQENRLATATLPSHAGNDGEYHPITPARVLDTRDGTGGVTGPIVPNGTATVPVTGLVTGLPTDGSVAAVEVNLTVTGAAGNGDAKVYASTDPAPNTSNINWATGQTVANAAVAKVGTDGKITVKNGPGSNIQFIVDVSGWWSKSNGTNAGTFTPITPYRAATAVHIPAQSNVAVTVTGVGTIPATAVGSVTANVTATNSTGYGNITAYDGALGSPPTNYSTLNFSPGQTIANLAVVKTTNGTIRLYNSSTQQVDAYLDLFGWTASGDNANGSDLNVLTPARVYDTRPGTWCPTGCQLQSLTDRTLTLAGQGGIPNDPTITAVVLNVTATGSASAGWISVAKGSLGTSATSNVNFAAGQTIAASVVVAAGASATVTLRSNVQTDVIVDVAGYYNAATRIWTYSYNSDGTRKAKNGPNCTNCSSTNPAVKFAWAKTGGLPVLLTETVPGGTAVTSYIYGPGGLPVEQINPDGTILYIHHDQLGSTRLATNTTGDPVGYYSYDPYGNTTNTQGVNGNPPPTVNLAYAGQYTDPETGFIYMRARYYDPTTGQFLSRDPANALTRSAYGYVYGNPLNMRDPSGLCGLWGDDSCVGNAFDDVKGVIRAPDYVTIDVNYVFTLAAIPLGEWVEIPVGLGPGANLTITRDGKLFAGPEGAGGVGGGSGTVRAGWLNQTSCPDSSQLDDFVSGPGVTASGNLGVFSVGETYGFTGGTTATELGLGGGQSIGQASANYDWELPFRLPWSW